MTPDVTVIVPVMRRPQNAEPFMASLLESTDKADVLVVADEDDNETWRAWLQAMPKGAGRVVRSAWPAPGGTYAQKVNLGFRMLPWTTKWLFICGDDVRFEEGWLTETQRVMVAEPAARVIGVLDGSGSTADFSPHFLIATDYIGARGASWDGPGIVCHEGYRHNYVDNEIIAVAKQRGVWHMCRTSLVEHIHPAWRKGEWDDVYQMGRDSATEDGALFERRLR